MNSHVVTLIPFNVGHQSQCGGKIEALSKRENFL